MTRKQEINKKILRAAEDFKFGQISPRIVSERSRDELRAAEAV